MISLCAIRAAARALALCTLAVVTAPGGAAPLIPALSDRVVDNAGLLSAPTRAALIKQLAAHEAQTGDQIAVLTVTDLQGEALADYALAVARSWALGQAERDNGALLLIARDERAIRIEVGYGLEGDLTDGRAKRIIAQEIRPAFKRGDFDAGVRAGVDAMIGTLDGSYSPPALEESPLDGPLLPLGLFAVIGSTALLRERVSRGVLNGLVVGAFSGVFVTMASQLWWPGLLVALAVGLFVASRSASNSARRAGGHYPSGHHGADGGHFGGGGFSGGGGGFGGGGASGGW